MTFAALSAWQAWTLIAVAGVAAALLFRMKVRPPRIVVPSLLLWRRVFDRAAALTWWERVRRVVSLAITVLVAVALAVAVGRPGPRVSASSRGRLLIVLDASWSMRARTSDGATRWAHAVSAARALAQAAGSEDVAIATTADGLVEGPTSDVALVATALDRLSPSGGDSGAWPSLEGVVATHFFTDGAVVRPRQPGVVVHSVFEPAPNVAITAFSARPATSSTAAPSAYLEVSNFATHAQDVRITVTRETAVLVDRRVTLAPGEVSREVVALTPDGGARLRAHVSAPDDALDVDDDAVSWLTLADPIAVTVVSDAPQPIGELLRHDPNIRATFKTPAAYSSADAGDVLIFDRWVPAQPPPRPALYIAPSTSPWLGRITTTEIAPRWTTLGTHAVLAGVDPLTLDIARARQYDGDGLQAIARSEQGTALLSVVDAGERRAVVIAFSLAESNLAAAPVFPVLIGNAIDWLARPAAGESREPGPMELPASTSRVVAPDGGVVPLVRAGDRAFATLRAQGFYLVETGGSRSVVGVNVGAPEIANLMRTSLSDDERRNGGALGLAGRPWWTSAVLLAILLLAVEWCTWQRRVTV
ncbi:MAG: VWA domain-containing protein [Acidobacteria bacterium]|nr:VWA domain-containing protein [Acidobacteriota bacterium]